MPTRRDTAKKLGAAFLGLSFLSKSASATALESKGKVIVTGAHPDDPETGCGGTIQVLQKMGYEVVVYYLTRGEAGIAGKTHQEAAALRTKEAEKACEILGVKGRFLGQVDGDCVVNNESYKNIFKILEREDPELILTHWPIDTHKDHRACSLLTYNAWLNMSRKPALYYYEVMSGDQTQNFNPTDFVDISSVAENKLKACLAHSSQIEEAWYEEYHAKMEAFRGLEKGCDKAEGFVKHSQSKVFTF